MCPVTIERPTSGWKPVNEHLKDVKVVVVFNRKVINQADGDQGQNGD